MIGIIGALKMEVEELRNSMTDRVDETCGSFLFSRGFIDGTECAVCVCGVGKVNAAAVCQAMIIKYAPSLIINTGVAGAIDPSLRIGDIVVSSFALQHDFDTTALGESRGWIQELNCIYVRADADAAELLLKASEEAGLRCCKGIIATGDVFVAELARREFLREEFGATVCEMEGAAVATVCTLNKIPFVILRAVSDRADGEATSDFPAFIRAAAANTVNVLKKALKAM